MFQSGRAGSADPALRPLLEGFARWSATRAAAQTGMLIPVEIAVAACDDRPGAR